MYTGCFSLFDIAVILLIKQSAEAICFFSLARCINLLLTCHKHRGVPMHVNHAVLLKMMFKVRIFLSVGLSMLITSGFESTTKRENVTGVLARVVQTDTLCTCSNRRSPRRPRLPPLVYRLEQCIRVALSCLIIVDFGNRTK